MTTVLCSHDECDCPVIESRIQKISCGLLHSLLYIKGDAPSPSFSLSVLFLPGSFSCCTFV